MSGIDRFLQSAVNSRPELRAAAQLRADLYTLQGVLAWPPDQVPKRRKARAFRILLARFSKLEVRELIAAEAEVSNSYVKISLQQRLDKEVPDTGDARREWVRDLADAELLKAYHHYLSEGHPPAQAIDAAARLLGVESSGTEGLKKVLTRARKSARQRGYIDPLAPTKTALTGMWEEPQLRLQQLTSRGRPKKRKPAE